MSSPFLTEEEKRIASARSEVTRRANAGRIIIPSPAGAFYWEEQEEKSPAKVWRKPSARAKIKPAKRTWTLINTPVDMGKGVMKQFTPIQVALMALEEAMVKSFDFIRVITKEYKGKGGDQAQADVTFAVGELKRRYGPHSCFQPARNQRGEFEMGENAQARGPVRWAISPQGILHPSSF